MATPADMISQGGAIEMNVELEWLKAQKVSDDCTLQAQRQRVEKLDAELRKSRDKIHRRTRKNRKLLRMNIVLSRKLEGKDGEAFRLKRYVRRELTEVNDEAIEKVREAAQLAEYHSKDASAKEEQIVDLQDKLLKITKEKNDFQFQASVARLELSLAKSRVDEELEKRQLTVATVVESRFVNEINRLQAQHNFQSQEIEQLKSFLEISLKTIAVLNGIESPQVILEQIQLAVQRELKTCVQNEQKASQLREDVLQKEITELKELAMKAEITIANANDLVFEMSKSKNDSERKLLAEEEKSSGLCGRILTLEHQHKAAIRKLEDQHEIAMKKLRSQHNTELIERTDKIVDWLAQDAEADVDFFQRQFTLARQEIAQLRRKPDWREFAQLQKDNGYLQSEIKFVRALASQAKEAFASEAKEKVEVAPQASEQTRSQTAATSSTDADAPQAEEATCPIEGIWEHVPIPSASVEQETFVESFQCTPNMRNCNRHRIHKRSGAIPGEVKSDLSIDLSSVDPNICRMRRRARASRLNTTKHSVADDSSSDSKDQDNTAVENITQENSEERISEASTLVAENSEMGESTSSSRADASGSASSNEESITAENNSNEESADIYESSTSVAENSEMGESTGSSRADASGSASRNEESIIAENNSSEEPADIYESSTSVAENSEMGESTGSSRADTSGSASRNEESIIAENNSNEESADIYESSTLVVENSDIVDSIASGQSEATLPTHDTIETQAVPEILVEADTEIQANLNVIANTNNNHADKNEEANCVQSNFEDVQEHNSHVVSRRDQAEIHDEGDKDDEDDFSPRLWKLLPWITLLAVFLPRLLILGLLKIPINEVHIQSPDCSNLRSILFVDSETQAAPSSGVVSFGLNSRSNLDLPTITLATPVLDAPKCEGWMEEYIQSVIMLPEPTSSPHDTPAPEPVFEQPAPVSTWSSITGFFNAPYKVAGWGLGASSAWLGWQQRGVISTWWR